MDNSKRWLKLYDYRPQGHAFFEDLVTGRIAVADGSGNLPPDTEDGILWLNVDEPVVFRDNEAGVPVIDEKDDCSIVPMRHDRAIEAAWRFGLDVHFTATMSRFAKILTWMVDPGDGHRHYWNRGDNLTFDEE